MGCGNQIGDSCGSSADCSNTGSRLCDTAQPGGYCTVFMCEPNSCPGGSRCIEWQYSQQRTSARWCMRGCETDKDCRTNEGYACVLPSAIEVNGQPVARTIDLDAGAATAKICAAVNAP